MSTFITNRAALTIIASAVIGLSVGYFAGKHSNRNYQMSCSVGDVLISTDGNTYVCNSPQIWNQAKKN